MGGEAGKRVALYYKGNEKYDVYRFVKAYSSVSADWGRLNCWARRAAAAGRCARMGAGFRRKREPRLPRGRAKERASRFLICGKGYAATPWHRLLAYNV